MIEDYKKLSEEEKNKINEERISQLNEKVEEIKERQESELTCDFDKALDEYVNSNKKFTVRFLGKIYELPNSMPFNFQTFFLRHCYKKIDGKMVIIMPDDKIFMFIKLMFGGKFLTALEQTNNVHVTLNFVNKVIIPRVMQEWGYDINNKDVKELEKKLLTQE